MRLGNLATGASALSMMFLTACGTTYTVPAPGETSLSQARAMFAQERELGSEIRPTVGSAHALRQFERVIARVEPAAEAFCRSQTTDRPSFNCDVHIIVDHERSDRNAYQTYTNDGSVIVAFTVPLIADARNEDELAFVLGHEVGHHVGQHIQKSRQQAMAGALIMGALVAYGQAQANAANPYRYTGNDSANMRNAMDLGAGLGDMAFSQTYELESDMIGTYIATSAGYDPIVGARFFARPEEPVTPQGARSFWGTHPSDEVRLATVIETVGQIRATASQP
ncbi:M48 family metalloprotease [Wenxinia marina]|uniref:Peptidase family M48 n=1 Tax=Wenxinia marina DSM 24838 TaxID=1123501 RepID=A0A0D0QBR6_9RHOB|nr:M48 family metalloprotease [Wenxinia marina]KIQ69702.1 Peptidase family M48 [Wenxinia marina DSM 24838]GGL60534.1 peptidase M48 [Wenxinia marina]